MKRYTALDKKTLYNLSDHLDCLIKKVNNKNCSEKIEKELRELAEALKNLGMENVNESKND